LIGQPPFDKIWVKNLNNFYERRCDYRIGLQIDTVPHACIFHLYCFLDRLNRNQFLNFYLLSRFLFITFAFYRKRLKNKNWLL